MAYNNATLGRMAWNLYFMGKYLDWPIEVLIQQLVDDKADPFDENDANKIKQYIRELRERRF